MEKIFRRTTQSATLGGIIGTAIGVLTTAGAVIATGPIGASAIVALAVGSATASGVSAGTIGTLIGGGVGAASSTAETIHDSKKKKEG
jgi:hypothetical protein